MGEAVELVSCCAWGNESLVLEAENVLGDQAVTVASLNGFTPEQLAERAEWNGKWGGFDWRPAPSAPDSVRPWIAAEEPGTSRTVFLPAEYVLIGLREAGDEDAGAIADSNGCASGPTHEAARLRAVLELVERDAAARWWYGRRSRPRLHIGRIGLPSEVADVLVNRDRRTRVFDISTDLGARVAAAASFRSDGRVVALGFAARLSPAAAARAALREMLAVESTLPPWRSAADAVAVAWLSKARASRHPLVGSAEIATDWADGAETEGTGLSSLIDAAQRSKCRILFVDLTRPLVGVPVWRAVSPDLCTLRPRFGRLRLLAHDARDNPISRAGATKPNPIVIPL